MSKLQAIELQLQQLSTAEMRQIRDWLDSMLKQQPDRQESAETQLYELREEIAAGINQACEGKVTPFDDAAVARIKARGRKLSAGE